MKTILLIGVLFVAQCGEVAAQQRARIIKTWEDKLFESGVNYGSFACKDSYASIVDEYFRKHPLIRILNVCHNNCAVLKSIPVGPPPPFDKKVIGSGFIAVHVMVNELGTPIYARAVNGQWPMRAILRARACRATFRPPDTYRQRVLYFCFSDNCEVAQPVDQGLNLDAGG